MRLFHQLALFLLVAAVGPVAVVGFSLLSGAERELSERIGAQQASLAEAAAQMASRDVEEAVESLARTAESIRWAELGPEERSGALRLLVQQSRHFAAAALLGPDGSVLVGPVAAPGPSAPEPASLSGREEFLAAVPLAELAGGAAGAVALSPAYLRRDGSSCGAALAVAVPGEGGLLAAAVELRLSEVQRRAEAGSRRGAGALYVIDPGGRLLAAPAASELGRAAPAEDLDFARTSGTGPAFSRYLLAGSPVLASAARTPDRLGWTALIRLPESEAFEPVARLRRTVLLSIGAGTVLLLVAGLAFTRRLARRVERLSEGAEAFARGELSARVPEAGADEVAKLARRFNAMGSELQAARGRLETWNEELRKKVEERTAELKAAQAQLLEAQKLAAIGQLGAGVAHEINNPLAGILGNAQLLLLDRPEGDRDAALLRKIEAQAKRAKEITGNLLRFSQQRPAPDFRAVDLNRVARETLTLVETQLRAEGIEPELRLADDLPFVSGDPGHLSQVLLNLVSNARTAMLKSCSKRLAISTRAEGDRVLLEVEDSGHGIAEKDLPRLFEPFFTTKEVWSNVGLGLSVSYRIVSEHGGRISVRTQVGQGSTFSVELPRRP